MLKQNLSLKMARLPKQTKVLKFVRACIYSILNNPTILRKTTSCSLHRKWKTRLVYIIADILKRLRPLIIF